MKTASYSDLDKKIRSTFRARNAAASDLKLAKLRNDHEEMTFLAAEIAENELTIANLTKEFEALTGHEWSAE